MNTKVWNIDEIHAITEDKAKALSSEHRIIKDHDIYLVDFGGYFGYSVLVFADHHHIYYANDYQLHHRGNRWSEISEKNKAQLKEFYVDSLNSKLFTETELRKPIQSYDEYSRKDFFLRNYFGMRRDNVSIFFTGTEAERERIKNWLKSEKMIYNPVALAYYKLSDSDFVERQILLFAELNKRQSERKSSFAYLKEAFIAEMWNHEYFINNYQGNYDVLSFFGPIQYVENDNYEDYFDQLSFDDTHRKAFIAARKEYFKQVEKSNLW